MQEYTTDHSDSQSGDDDRADVLKRVLGDDVLTATERLRDALARYTLSPRSQERQEALIQALEDLMALQVNRVQGTTGQVLVGPVGRMEGARKSLANMGTRIRRLRKDLTQVKKRVGALDEQYLTPLLALKRLVEREDKDGHL